MTIGGGDRGHGDAEAVTGIGGIPFRANPVVQAGRPKRSTPQAAPTRST
ncbi:hypothetical protein [Mycobacterium simulans]|nr:hypothetical protein [Mycobacterium simulans]